MLTGRKINRKKLAALAFLNRQTQHTLNKIMHPLLQKKIMEQVHPPGNYVIDAALYYELGLDKIAEVTILVKAPLSEIKKRMCSQYTPRDFQQRTRFQHPPKKPDYVIYNHSLQKTRQETFAIIKILSRK
ncbi:dephospho-CoA kinase [Candidatus Woesearchaeota archaeon]|nr:dephospho-CoA kinase [Candidatus Woesearchaeota archaeon]